MRRVDYDERDKIETWFFKGLNGTERRYRFYPRINQWAYSDLPYRIDSERLLSNLEKARKEHFDQHLKFETIISNSHESTII